jgi:hypothetical protein
VTRKNAIVPWSGDARMMMFVMRVSLLLLAAS